MTAYFYILSCSDGTFYTEVTHDLVNRVGEHIEGLNPSAYTYSRRPVKLVHYETFDTIEQALKRWSELARTTRWKKSEMLKIGLGK